MRVYTQGAPIGIVKRPVLSPKEKKQRKKKQGRKKNENKRREGRVQQIMAGRL